MAETVQDLIGAGTGEAPAITAPDRAPLSHDELRALMTESARALRGFGIAGDDRVAIVLPNGPEMASAFVTIACAAATAPLNPAYRADELDFYLGDLKPRALVVQDGADGPAVEAAQRAGVRVLRLRPLADGPAGAFTLHGDGAAPAADAAPAPPRPDDLALILHTSGTTSRPKMVPLTHRNLAASAGHIAATLKLGPSDRCLNVMPLFHIHGLIAAVLSSLGAGGSVACTPGFNALKLFGWMDQLRPTWMTAVPTMHQAILGRAERQREVIERVGLRLIRSSSASLPPQVMRELEATFGCPVIESYGMTEASHQMTSNPLPPGTRKPGSVGLPAGPQVRVADAEGSLLPAGATGEVVISGPNVTPGYLENPAADASAFFTAEGHRWFRTGDQGVIDEDGHLRITGRLKEIINRGGEKVSPLEVDEVLMDHPAVRQVVTFAVPHDKLGEEVAAAVVLRDGQSVTERELRDFAGGKLAAFKVPRTVLVVDEIPKGATGKLQRIGLAQKLGLG